jgi:chromosomal replication initiation ATPase DnaA
MRVPDWRTAAVAPKAESTPSLAPVVYPIIPPEDPYVPTTTPSVRLIQNVVASYYEITRAQLIGKGRIRSLMKPRHIAVYLARELTGFSTLQLGRFFGNKDHTVILNSEKRIKTAILQDDDLALDIATLIQRITGVQQ